MTPHRRIAIIAGIGAWMAALFAGVGLVLVYAMHVSVVVVVVLCAAGFVLMLALLIALVARPDLAYPTQEQLERSARRVPPGGVPVLDRREPPADDRSD